MVRRHKFNEGSFLFSLMTMRRVCFDEDLTRDSRKWQPSEAFVNMPALEHTLEGQARPIKQAGRDCFLALLPVPQAPAEREMFQLTECIG